MFHIVCSVCYDVFMHEIVYERCVHGTIAKYHVHAFIAVQNIIKHLFCMHAKSIYSSCSPLLLFIPGKNNHTSWCMPKCQTRSHDSHGLSTSALSCPRYPPLAVFSSIPSATVLVWNIPRKGVLTKKGVPNISQGKSRSVKGSRTTRKACRKT